MVIFYQKNYLLKEKKIKPATQTLIVILFLDENMSRQQDIMHCEFSNSYLDPVSILRSLYLLD